jgi:hypothetical protein
MGTEWEEALVCKVFVKRYDNGLPLLCPCKQFCIGPSGERDVRSVMDGPLGATSTEPWAMVRGTF